MSSTVALQARLAALGFPPGPIDGLRGRRTKGALEEAMAAHHVSTEKGLFHPSGLSRIHWHWTAGAEGVIDLEKEHYHYIIDASGAVVEGKLAPEANGDPITGDYAAHTLNANTGAIGIAIDAMANAVERPFSWGTEPIKQAQVEAMAQLTVLLCREYWIPVSKYSTLSHAEVQPTLGIRQRWKWDISVLPDMSAPGDPVEVGDRLRAMVREYMGDKPPLPNQPETPPAVPPEVAKYREIAAIVNRKA